MNDASPFTILPAIDLRGGRVVRLRQGDFDRETAYGADPAAVAWGFAEAGARWLHVVDLDAARTGEPGSVAAIAAILEAVGSDVSVELAGGIRSDAAVDAALAAGAVRVIVGTAALRDPSWVGRLVTAYGPDRVAVALDVRAGRAVGQGWVRDAGGSESGGPGASGPDVRGPDVRGRGASGPDAADTLRRLADEGITTFEVTAIERDGLLEGPDLALYGRLVGLVSGTEVIASGGIADLDDLRAVREVGCSGAIIGRALYEGRIDLREALMVGSA